MIYIKIFKFFLNNEYTFFLYRKHNKKLKPINAISIKQFRRRILQERAKVKTSIINTKNTLQTNVTTVTNNSFVPGLSHKNVNYDNNIIEIDVPTSKIIINRTISDNLDNIVIPEDSNNQIQIDNSINILSNVNKANLQKQLSQWATQHNIKQIALTHLLKILKLHINDDLPIDARTLLKTPRTTIIKEVIPGEYFHFGLLSGVINFLKQHDTFSLTKTDIEIIINIDGLPISKSSNGQLWPILGSVFPYNHVFMIGLYHGKQRKPDNSNEFLFDFIKETKEIYRNNIIHDGKKFKFKIKGFSVDAPAKSFMLHTKGHGGYSSCTKCEVEGEYIEKRICFLDENVRLRTDKDFENCSDYEYHTGRTDLLSIPNIGLVSNAPLDYQHLICLGVTKKLISLWLCGSLNVRLNFKKVKNISMSIEKNILMYVPIEFQRQPRSLIQWKQWKATEFRQLLLYTGPVVLQYNVNSDVYLNFLTLHVAIRILCTDSLIKQTEFIQYSHSLLLHFVKSFKTIYGEHHVSHNVHALIHICNDVLNYGTLDSFSTFKFENYMQKIKNMIRKDDKPLQQIIRRVEEIKTNYKATKCNCELSDTWIYKKQHYSGPLPITMSNP